MSLQFFRAVALLALGGCSVSLSTRPATPEPAPESSPTPAAEPAPIGGVLGQGPHCSTAGTQRYCFQTKGEQDKFDQQLAKEQQEQERQRAEVAQREEAQKQAEQDYIARQEQKRASVVAEQQAQQTRLQKLANDKPTAVRAISGILCAIEESSAQLRAEMAHERKVTAAGGVADLSERRRIADGLVSNDASIADWKAVLKRRFGATRAPCSSVAKVVACVTDLPSCDDESRGPAEAWAKAEHLLQGAE